MEDTALEKAMVTARHLLSDGHRDCVSLARTPLHMEEQGQVGVEGEEMETTLQGIVSMEQLYVRLGVPQKIRLSIGFFFL